MQLEAKVCIINFYWRKRSFTRSTNATEHEIKMKSISTRKGCQHSKYSCSSEVGIALVIKPEEYSKNRSTIVERKYSRKAKISKDIQNRNTMLMRRINIPIKICTTGFIHIVHTPSKGTSTLPFERTLQRPFFPLPDLGF